jgi:hypothetical protein
MSAVDGVTAGSSDTFGDRMAETLNPTESLVDPLKFFSGCDNLCISKMSTGG